MSGSMPTAANMNAWHDERFGPLPIPLLVLTMVTGLVDAVSYLKLGQVFVANMTGNLVFLGFAVSDAQDFSIPASLMAIAGGANPSLVRRLFATGAIFVGAAIGAFLVLNVSVSAALALALALLAVNAIATRRMAQATAPWTVGA